MDDSILISVLMPVYKEPINYVRASLTSILKQTYRNIEILVIIDDPENVNIIEYIIDESKKDSRIKMIFNKKNIGLVNSLNKGIQLARGTFIARMDADDISIENRLEDQLRYIVQNNYDIIGCNVKRIDEAGNLISVDKAHDLTDTAILYSIKQDNIIPHPTWMVKRKTYIELNGYRNLFACEDYDFLLRAIKKGYKVGIDEKTLLCYRINTNGISRNNSLRQLITSVYLQKNFYRLDFIEENRILDNVAEKITDKNSYNYEKSLSFYDKALNLLKQKEYLLGIANLVSAIFCSKYIFVKIRRLLNIHKIRAKYSRTLK